MHSNLFVMLPPVIGLDNKNDIDEAGKQVRWPPGKDAVVIVDIAQRMSVDQVLTWVKWRTTDAGSLAPPCSAYSSSSHS